MRRRPTRVFLAILTLSCCVGAVGNSFSVAEDKPLPSVPDGFTIERVAGYPLVEHPMLANFDDRGRLFIAESAGKNLPAAELLTEFPNFIRMLEDTDDDGVFDKSTIFADRMTFPMGALWYRGALYVASPPNIWRLEDTDDDGVADRREVIVTKFGFTGNAADVHGCFLGPEGRIYWVEGRHGHEFRDGIGNITSKGLGARIFSCKTDGSDVQIYCGGGMDNPVEIDFTPEGEIFGTVNILLTNPRVDCLMHWLEGGAYPHYEVAVNEFKRTGDLLQPMTKMGHVAVSGMMFYRSPHFGADYQQNVFTCLFNTHKVVRSKVERSGATFVTQEEDFLVSSDSDFHPTDVLEDADGSLLVIDTGGWFRIGCPVSQVAKPELKGAIYRIRKKDAPVLDDPRGLKLGLQQLPVAKLIEMLDDPRHAVRSQVIDLIALSQEPVIDALKDVLVDSSTSIETRRNAIWSLSRIPDEAAVLVIASGLNDEQESVRMTALRALGSQLRTVKQEETLVALARHVTMDTPPVRRDAANALGWAGQKGPGYSDEARAAALEALFESLRKADADRTLEHALIFAVIRINDREGTIPYLSDSSPVVRRAALIALDQMDGGNLTRDLVTPLLDTDDPALQQSALAIMTKHEGWASETLDLLRTWLSEADWDESRSAVVRGFLLAQASQPEIQQLIAETMQRAETSLAVKLLLWEVIHRSSLTQLPELWTTLIEQTLTNAEVELRLQALQVIQDRKLGEFDSTLQKLVAENSTPDAVKVEALAAVATRSTSVAADQFAFLVGQFREETPPFVQISAARALSDLPLDTAQLKELTNLLDRAGPLALPLLLKAFSHSDLEEVGMSLVTALEKSNVSETLAAEELAGILRKYPAPVQSAAEGLLKKLGGDLAAQREQLAALLPNVAEGNLEHGKEIFFGKKAACGSCHRVETAGGRVGPDLTKIGGIRKQEDLLEAVVLPSATFAREYRPYVIVTTEGKILIGVISQQSADSVTLRTADLAEIRILRDQIDEIKESPTSIMPKGFDKLLTNQELADLLAYLRTLK
ncbi:MAG: PVC-type heme-binding CxxCH protein [Planctomycetaceae bacterium]